MHLLLNLLLRAVLLAAGLVFAAAFALAIAFMVALWLLRAAWARLTGRAPVPFVMRMQRGQAFADRVRRASQARRKAGDFGFPSGRAQPDVTDVEVRELR